MPTPRWSILFRPFPCLADVSCRPGPRPDHSPDHRLERAVRQAADRDLGLAPGGAGADLDRIAGRKTAAGAARHLAVDLGGGLGRAAARVCLAAVAAIPNGVIWRAGSDAIDSGAALGRNRRSP